MLSVADRPRFEFDLPDEGATERFAQDMAMVAKPGWTIALHGDLGVGKTSFARAFIRSLARDPVLEVPSPTYTLVQPYSEPVPSVIHADLYRLSDPSELQELGLDDPDDPAIRLIEWPDRAGDDAFVGALHLTLSISPSGGRLARLHGPDPMLEALAHSARVRAFLDGSGYAHADRVRLAGDASARRYECLGWTPDAPIVMDAPRRPDGPPVRVDLGPAGIVEKPYSQLVHLAEDVDAFIAVGTALRANGLAAPAIHAADRDHGLLVIENLGSDGVLDSDGKPIAERYCAAADALAEMHAKDWHAELPISTDAWPGHDGSNSRQKPGRGLDGSAIRADVSKPHQKGDWHTVHAYDTEVFLTEISLCPDWYIRHRASAGAPIEAFDRHAFFASWQALLDPLETAQRTLVLRDYHSPNIIWRGEQEGVSCIGIIDHQDALMGPPAYDLASLIHDARVTISPALQDTMLSHYRTMRQALEHGFDETALRQSLALMQAQRGTKILGIFARLNERDGKPQYLAHLPRIETYLRQALTHPALAPLRPHYEALLPGDVD